MGFSRQECWSGLPFSSPGDLPYPGIEPGSPALQADSLPHEPLNGQVKKNQNINGVNSVDRGHPSSFLKEAVLGLAPKASLVSSS